MSRPEQYTYGGLILLYTLMIGIPVLYTKNWRARKYIRRIFVPKCTRCHMYEDVVGDLTVRKITTDGGDRSEYYCARCTWEMS